jgi:hypothetical protein
MFVKVGDSFISMDKVTEIRADETLKGFVIRFWLADDNYVATNRTFKTKEEADEYIAKILQDQNYRERAGAR